MHLSHENLFCESIQTVPEPEPKVEEELPPKKVPVPTQHNLSVYLKTSFLIMLVLIPHVTIFKMFESDYSTTLKQYELAEELNQSLRMEINTLKKIIFLMGIDNPKPRITIEPIRAEQWKRILSDTDDFRIVNDENNSKLVCIDINRLIDLIYY